MRGMRTRNCLKMKLQSIKFHKGGHAYGSKLIRCDCSPRVAAAERDSSEAMRSGRRSEGLQAPSFNVALYDHISCSALRQTPPIFDRCQYSGDGLGFDQVNLQGSTSPL
jgi:hypothetical protein